MTTSTVYPLLVHQLDAGAFPVVPAELKKARAGLHAATEAMRQVDAVSLLQPVAVSVDGVALGRVTPSGPAALAQSLAERLTDGEPLPDDLVELAYEATISQARAAAADDVARRLATACADGFDRVADACMPALETGLRAQLSDLVTRTLAAGQALGDYDVARPALLVDAPDQVRAAYATLGELVEEYATLRAAQRAMRRADEVTAYRQYDVLGLDEVQDALDLWPQWHQEGMVSGLALPWPEDPRARLLLVASREPWVPVLEQMAAVRQGALAALRSAA